ncbi:MAG: hypothetical protein M1822_010104 [Bathelium mastoideum]|nr:MAG: hypothetical protein M1822_010104 [Bathelium mastoideum]
MDAYPPELVSALFKWVKTFECGESVKSWSDLRDGEALWAILQDIDPDYFSGTVPEYGHRTSKDYVLRLQNSPFPRWSRLKCPDADIDFYTVKYIERSVAKYIGGELERLPNTVNKLCPALDGIAGDKTAQEAPKVSPNFAPADEVSCAEITSQLVMAILLCAMYSPKANARMVGRMQGLGNEAAFAIAAKIKDIEDIDRKTGYYLAETNNGVEHDNSSTAETFQASRGPSLEVDMELQKEEKLIQAYKLIAELQEKNSRMSAELERARDRKESLEEEIAEYKVLDQGNLRNNEELQYLTSQAAKDKNYIASLESELQTSQAELETKTRQLDVLRAKSESVSELQDQLQFIKAERDELIQHRNANENLKKKIQSLQEQTRSDEFLKQDLQSAREQLQEYDRLKDDRDALLKANEEKSKVIANCEQEIFDSKSTKKRLESDIKAALQRYESMKERQQRDHETIQELQEQIDASQGNSSQGLGNLDAELAAGEAHQEALVQQGIINIWMRVAMLTSFRKVKTAESKPTVDGGAEVELLRQRVAAVESRNTVLENNYLDVYQDKLGLETTLNELKDQTGSETLSCLHWDALDRTAANAYFSSHPFLHQREQLHVLQRESKDKQEEIFALQAELAQIKAAQDLGLSKEDEYKKLSANIEEQRSENSSLNTKLDEKDALLRTALLNANAHQREADAEQQDYNFILSQLEAAREASVDASILQGTATKLAQRLEEGREMVKEAHKVNSHIHASELNDKLSFVLVNSPRHPWVEHATNGAAFVPALPAVPKPARRNWLAGGAVKRQARPVSKLAPISQPMASQAKMAYKASEEQRAEASEHRIRALEIELEEAKRNGGDKASQDELENLKRENALMTTACQGAGLGSKEY